MLRSANLFGLLGLGVTVSCSSPAGNGNAQQSGGTAGASVAGNGPQTSGGGSSSAGGTQTGPQTMGGSTSMPTTGNGGMGSAGQPPTAGNSTTPMGGGAGGTPPVSGGAGSSMGGAAAGMAGSSGGESSAGAGGGGTGGPPAGAYVACSGDAPPALKLTTVIEDLDLPIFATTPEGDAQTMFVVERGGALKRFDLSQTPPTSVTILEVNSSTANECGFFSVALHPNFDGTGEKRIYVSYMPDCPASIFGAGGSSTLDEYTVEGDTATFTQTLLSLDQPQGNHNGGLTKFGPDGYLYLGLGDGGGGNDNSTGHSANGNGQDVSVPLGKLLRFDVDAVDTPPAGNLTSGDVGGGTVHPAVFHRGLRNPWRWSFDKLTGDLYIGDVGQDTCEEINFLPADTGASNFGWSSREGSIACPGCSGHTVFPDGSETVDPIFTYPTDKTQAITGGCDHPLSVGGATNGAVIGGYVYRGNKIPGLYGRFLFTDFERKNGNRAPIFALTADGDGNCDFVDDLIPSADLPSESVASFAEDADGELYVVNMTRGEISRIDPE